MVVLLSADMNADLAEDIYIQIFQIRIDLNSRILHI